MTGEELRHTIADLAHTDDTVRTGAQHRLLMEDEAIITALIDEFYAGVSLPTGSALLEVMGRIGGYQVTALFFELVNDSAVPVVWHEIANRWLRHDGMI